MNLLIAGCRPVGHKKSMEALWEIRTYSIGDPVGAFPSVSQAYGIQRKNRERNLLAESGQGSRL